MQRTNSFNDFSEDSLYSTPSSPTESYDSTESSGTFESSDLDGFWQDLSAVDLDLEQLLPAGTDELTDISAPPKTVTKMEMPAIPVIPASSGVFNRERSFSGFSFPPPLVNNIPSTGGQIPMAVPVPFATGVSAYPQHLPSVSTKRSCGVSMENDMVQNKRARCENRREDRRMKNRAAANRSRQRRKTTMETLQTEVGDLTLRLQESNTLLAACKAENASLKEQNAFLQKLLTMRNNTSDEGSTAPENNDDSTQIPKATAVNSTSSASVVLFAIAVSFVVFVDPQWMGGVQSLDMLATGDDVSSPSFPGYSVEDLPMGGVQRRGGGRVILSTDDHTNDEQFMLGGSSEDLNYYFCSLLDQLLRVIRMQSFLPGVMVPIATMRYGGEVGLWRVAEGVLINVISIFLGVLMWSLLSSWKHSKSKSLAARKKVWGVDEVDSSNFIFMSASTTLPQ